MLLSAGPQPDRPAAQSCRRAHDLPAERFRTWDALIGLEPGSSFTSRGPLLRARAWSTRARSRPGAPKRREGSKDTDAGSLVAHLFTLECDRIETGAQKREGKHKERENMMRVRQGIVPAGTMTTR